MLKSEGNRLVVNDFVTGDPLSEENLKQTIDIVCGIGVKKETILYSNWEIPAILKSPTRRKIASFCNYIVDGRFKKEYQKVGLKWRGSRNQHIWKNENGKWTNITYEI